MATRDYEGTGIVVHWDAAICEHSRRCIGAAPEVFDPQRRPWVDVTAAEADRIALAVDQCPSGALSYTRTDGGAEGPGTRSASVSSTEGGAAATDGGGARIEQRADGPLIVTGSFAVLDAEGQPLEVGDRAALCRCGRSGTKPFCDGTHKQVAFQAPGVVPPRKPGTP